MTFFSLTLKNLARRRFRTALTISALATAVAAVVALLAVADGFTDSFAKIYQSHRVDLVVSRTGTADRLSSTVEETFVDEIAQAAGVQSAAGVLLETLSLEDQQIYGIPAMGMLTETWLMDDYEFDQRLDQPPTAAIYLGENLAERAGLSTGDPVNLFGDPFTVAGVFRSTSVWESGSMILPLGQLQNLAGRDGSVTYVNVRLHPDADGEAAIGAIESIDPKLTALATQEFVDTDTRLRLAGAMAWMTSVIAILVGSIGTLNTMMTSVIERTGEIGLLRATGWPASKIVRLILAESTLLAAASVLLGTAGAVVLLQMVAANPAAAGLIAPAVTPAVLIRGAAIGLLIGWFGALLPAFRAARMQPAEALRQIA